MSSRRNYGIDLLRIVSMFMIAVLHVLGQGGVLYNLDALSIKYNLSWLLEIICYSSVDCYALITGYVMINSKFSYKKIFNLWIGVVFWSVLLTIIMNGIYPDLIGKRDIVRSLFPIIFSEYWYFSSYFCLFFFIPFLNKFINILEYSDFKRLIITMICLFSFVNLLTDPFKLGMGYSFVWLLVSYFIGAYIKKYGLFKKVKSRWIFLVICLCFLLTWCFKLFFVKYPFLTFDFFGPDLLISYNSFTILFASIGFLILFSRLKINNKYFRRFVKRLAPVTFGVYIIHVQSWVWKLFINQKFSSIINYDSVIMVLLVLFFVFMLYMLCSFLEMIRIWLFKKIKIYRFSDMFFEKLKSFLSL